MSGSRLDFFGDKDDLLHVFESFDAGEELIYVSTLSELNRQNIRLNSAKQLLSYLVTHEKPVQRSRFLITYPSVPLVVGEIRMHDGSGVKSSLSQIPNPDSAVILLGGEAAPRTIVQTSITTTGETTLAKNLYKNLNKIVVKNCERVGQGYYVAPRAFLKLQAGWRLTPGVGFAEEMDLKLPNGLNNG